MTTDRLAQYYPFEHDIRLAVDEAAAEQNELTFPELTTKYGVEGGPEIVAADGKKPFEIMRLRPESQDYDETHARIVHFPMATGLDPAMAVRMLRLFAADPAQQLIAIGNHAVGRSTGRLTFREARRVWHGDLAPTVDPQLAYLASLGIKSADHLGYSYGADKAATAAARSSAHDIEFRTGIWAESAASIDRGFWGLAKAFVASGAPVERYVAANQNPVLTEARQLAHKHKLRYFGNLLCPTNLGIWNALAHDGHEERAAAALRSQPNSRAALIWGDTSELAVDLATLGIAERLRVNIDDGFRRVGGLIMKGMHHAGGDDIDLHAAMVLQGYRELDRIADQGA